MKEQIITIDYISNQSALLLGASAVGLLQKLVRNIDENNKVKVPIEKVNSIGFVHYPSLSEDKLQEALSKLLEYRFIEYSRDRKVIYIRPTVGFIGGVDMLKSLLDNDVLNYDDG